LIFVNIGKLQKIISTTSDIGRTPLNMQNTSWIHNMKTETLIYCRHFEDYIKRQETEKGETKEQLEEIHSERSWKKLELAEVFSGG
jgi:hypothetical protein